MADPLSMTASITAIVRMAYSLCSNICQTIDSIRGAPSQIRDLSNDIRSLYSILGTLKGYLDDEETATGVIHPATSADLEAVLSNCIVIFKDLNAKVNGFQGTSGPGDVALWRRLQWNWKEKGVVALRAQLANHTRTLQIAISVANLVNTRNTTASTQQIEEEVRQLRAALSNLPERLNEVYRDRGVILDNYKATIQRFAQSAKSVITTITAFERPPSPSIIVSFDEAIGGTSYAVEAVSMDATQPVEEIESREDAESLSSADSGTSSLTATYWSFNPMGSDIFNFGNPPPELIFQPEIESLELATFENPAAAKFIQFQVATPISDVQLRNVMSEQSGIPEDEIEIEFESRWTGSSGIGIERVFISYPSNVQIATLAFKATWRINSKYVEEWLGDTTYVPSTSLKLNSTRRVSVALFYCKGLEDKGNPRTFDVFLKVGVAKTLPFSPSAQLSAKVARRSRDGKLDIRYLFRSYRNEYDENEKKRQMESKQSRNYLVKRNLNGKKKI